MNNFKHFFMSLALSHLVAGAAVAEHILPETATPVAVSNRDVNRIVCSDGDINNVYFSQEKGLIVTNDGRNAFVKFKSIQEDGRIQRMNQRTELFVTCASNVYTLIMTPSDSDARTYYLGSGSLNNVKKNQDAYGSMPDEQRALELTLAVLKNEIPESFSVTKPSMYTREFKLNVIPSAQVAKVQEVEMDGIGLSLQEFQVVANTQLLLEETQFLDVYFGENILAISVEPRSLAKGEHARVFIVQKGAN